MKDQVVAARFLVMSPIPDSLPDFPEPPEPGAAEPVRRGRRGGASPSAGTRASLVNRLRDLGDTRSWGEFHATYSRLVRHVALRAGLNETEAEEAVQETWIQVAHKMPTFRYDPGRDSFKGWLLHLARFRIADQFRRRGASRSGGMDGRGVEDSESEGSGPADLEALWDAEWNDALAAAALERVRSSVRPEHFEIFHLAVVRQQPLREVARTLDVSLARVYLAKHRVGRAMRDAVRAVRADWQAD